VLLGRQRERDVLDRLLGEARDGQGSGVVVLGEPGIGKTALIEQAVTSAQDFRVLRALSHEGEMELAYAALERLCIPGLDHLDSFRRRLIGLTSPLRRLLLVAAAEPTGDGGLVWRAAELLGVAGSAPEGAEAEGLVDLTAGAVVFRHPLVRSAVYSTATPQERRQAHQALADATDPAVDPDRRGWHRAQATWRPDDDVAAELEASAGRAQARGGFAAAAAFIQRSTELTVDPAMRAGRALAAAEANHQAGAQPAALRLAALAERGPLDDGQRSQLDVLRAQISFASDRGGDAPLLLLKAAQRLERLDLRRARETYLDALIAALFAGRLSTGIGAREVAAAVRAAPRRPEPPGASDLLLDGLALLISDGYASGMPVLRQALSAFGRHDVGTQERLRWSWLPANSPGSPGTTTAGTCLRRARSKSPAMREPSRCSPSS
jgi:hypothetical protein